ncbi:MAG: nucleotidyltransferase family protein [Gordonia paraffinivorans]
MPRSTVGIVLAAGAGSRFGRPKVLVDDWLWRAVRALDAGGCSSILVTLGAAIVEVPAPATPVVVADWEDGISASVRSGVAAARAVSGMAGIVLTLVDLPDVDATIVERVLGASGRSPDAVVRAVYDGRPGHPVYVGADHLDALLASLDGDRGAGPFLASHPGLRTVECGDLATGRDVDRP